VTADLPLAVHLFAGPGGNEEGLRAAGWTGRQVGFEWDEGACLTAMANGHQRVRADVSQVSLRHLRGRVELVVGAPPCQPYSKAGDQLGLLDLEAVLERVDAFAADRTPADVEWHDARSPLAAEPMRHIAATRPRAVMLEQVPAVLPLWRHIASHLDRLGYSTHVEVYNAEEYGVPQTRRRAILAASLDTPVARPMPTHQRYRHGRTPAPDLFVRPWVSIREALGWDGEGIVVSNYGTGGVAADRGERSFDEPAATITSKAGRNKVVMFERQANGGRRTADEPSLTIMAGHDNGNLRIAEGDGHRRLRLDEALRLQGFRPDFQLLGSTEERWTQCGNATPPPLAAAVFRSLISQEASLHVA
jgi:DNA (cytosine-5)-methyltransferase 1